MSSVFDFLVSVNLIVKGFVKSMIGLKNAHLKPDSWSLPFYLAITLIRSFVFHHSSDLSAMRAVTDFPLVPTIPRSVWTQHRSISGVHVEIVFPHKPSVDWESKYEGDVVIYLHGGGFSLCNARTHRTLTRAISSLTSSVVIVPNYRRIPEFTVHDAVADCVGLYLAISEKIHPNRISIGGDSAGSALTILTLCALRDRAAVLPRNGFLLSPWCDIRLTGFTKDDGGHDYINREILSLMSSLVLSGADEKWINPMETDLSGLPPLLVHCGELELLRSEIRLFAKKLHADNVTVFFKEYPETVHVPHMFASLNKFSHEALLDLCMFLTNN